MANAKHIELPNGTILDLAGSGGTPSVIEKLYVGNATSGTITLDKSLEDFDEFVFYMNWQAADGDNGMDSKMHPTKYLLEAIEIGNTISLTGYDNRYVGFKVTSKTTLEIVAANQQSLRYIYGIKYGSSGGGSSKTTCEKIGHSNGTNYIEFTKSLSEFDFLYLGFVFIAKPEHILCGQTIIPCDLILSKSPYPMVMGGKHPYEGTYYYSNLTIQNESMNLDGNNNYVIAYGIKNGSSGGSSSIHKYSTEEKVVGEWIDGKPVYEITFDLGRIVDLTNFTKICDNIYNAKIMISIKTQNPQYGESGICGEMKCDSNGIYGGLLNRHGGQIFTIQYTKTTD